MLQRLIDKADACKGFTWKDHFETTVGKHTQVKDKMKKLVICVLQQIRFQVCVSIYFYFTDISALSATIETAIVSLGRIGRDAVLEEVGRSSQTIRL